MRKRLLFPFLFLIFTFCYAGAAFETDEYLIWISSKCAAKNTTCKAVTYNQTNKKSGKTLVIQGGEPIVGTLSGNLIGYTFIDTKNNYSFELSMDLNGDYFLYIRGFSRLAEKQKVTRISDSAYQQKIAQISKK